ncbi:DUF948 domain-containing protein [Maledivibacter halophilus]|uniref:Uncharacterized protein containing a divergent version of the methyl-accepting chemotaxis-like domain n=1 Tax=Maledivibacter halophilus TaxID=36842 RepID=A0A1T5M792_9FIRM|nr:DUF948 domain-containing protein [Maledivibacter halophilus]SKC83688.1 Uncharacterized protein containing a divergent version of the methyl-accepting chemotaxis-like domain [Maledivibacter halophilus]
MNEITISLSDLGLMLLWVALLVLIFYLILVLKKFHETIKEVKQILSINKEHIEKTLTEMPSIAKNIDEITGEVSHDVKSVRDTIDIITEKSGSAAKSLEDTDSIIKGITSIIQMTLFIKNFWEKNFSKKKRVL